MVYTSMTKKAMIFAYKAHKDQVDRAGVPYIFHPIHVAEFMTTEVQTCVALLHDVVEDTKYTITDLRIEGFNEEILEAIELLTRPEDMDYMKYIQRIKENPIACKVKIADLLHNSDETRLGKNVGNYNYLRERYKKALAYLEERRS
ncbi:Guanosine-3',5'-bis(Diphosphate) 3'-pyrophosphohydrolase [Lachnospiraceae bacterium TWA4]|nr:Guanosine-3',5'-bis(Diphosphate) 3'-pyrophosphohydrolase [Lachnospiraceae bacterium TWA4]